MIECTNCDTAQFLQIIESYVKFDADNTHPRTVVEKYECTICGSGGKLHLTGNDLFVKGDVRETNARPTVT